jgi:hypothetical protein
MRTHGSPRRGGPHRDVWSHPGHDPAPGRRLRGGARRGPHRGGSRGVAGHLPRRSGHSGSWIGFLYPTGTEPSFRSPHDSQPGDPTLRQPCDVGQKLGDRLAQVQRRGLDDGLGPPDGVLDWLFIACGIDQSAQRQSEHGAVGQHLIEVGVRVGGGPKRLPSAWRS